MLPVSPRKCPTEVTKKVKCKKLIQIIDPNNWPSRRWPLASCWPLASADPISRWPLTPRVWHCRGGGARKKTLSQTQKFMKIFQKNHPPTPPKKKAILGGGVMILNVVFAGFDAAWKFFADVYTLHHLSWGSLSLQNSNHVVAPGYFSSRTRNFPTIPHVQISPPYRNSIKKYPIENFLQNPACPKSGTL